MGTRKAMLATALACSIALPGAALAHLEGRDAKAEAAARDQATNRAMLDALLKRRAEIERSAATEESRRHAIEFLDIRIAQLRSRIGE